LFDGDVRRGERRKKPVRIGGEVGYRRILRLQFGEGRRDGRGARDKGLSEVCATFLVCSFREGTEEEVRGKGKRWGGGTEKNNWGRNDFQKKKKLPPYGKPLKWRERNFLFNGKGEKVDRRERRVRELLLRP